MHGMFLRTRLGFLALRRPRSNVGKQQRAPENQHPRPSGGNLLTEPGLRHATLAYRLAGETIVPGLHRVNGAAALGSQEFHICNFAGWFASFRYAGGICGRNIYRRGGIRRNGDMEEEFAFLQFPVANDFAADGIVFGVRSPTTCGRMKKCLKPGEAGSILMPASVL